MSSIYHFTSMCYSVRFMETFLSFMKKKCTLLKLTKVNFYKGKHFINIKLE